MDDTRELPPTPTVDELMAFVFLVRDMRRLQKRFFGGEKTASVVSQSKDLERRVDRRIADVTGEKQASLF